MNAHQRYSHKQYLQIIADHLLEWAKASENVLAWYWYGSYSIHQTSQGSDLDAAVLLRPGTDICDVRAQLVAALGDEVRMHLSFADPARVTCYTGDQHLKVECVLATEAEELAWLADSTDVPSPRLVLAFERDGAGQALANRAEQTCVVNVAALANREIDKFMEAFEACSRAHHRSDAYSFYFHYNLALGRLARLVQIARHKPERLYLPPRLTNTRLRPEERQSFIDLAGSLYLPEANEKKRKLAKAFLLFVEELERSVKVGRVLGEMRFFLDEIIRRDYFWNVRDWAEHLEGWIRPGVIIRASTLTRWQEDKELRTWLRDKQVRQIIDLRSDKPKDGKPYDDGVLEDIVYARHTIVQSGVMDNSDRSPHYLNIAMNNLPAITDVLRKLAVASGCSVVHCYAGVDRTGVVMALLGDMLGVPRALLMEDYIASGADLHRHSLSGFFDGIDARGGTKFLLREAGLRDSVVSLLQTKLLQD